MSHHLPSQRNYIELTKLIKTFGKRLSHTGPHKAEEVRALEEMFDLHLPPDYRQFLTNYGALSSDGLTIFGLGKVHPGGLPIVEAILSLRLVHPDMPLELVPLEDLGEGYFACMICNQFGTKDAPVVIVNILQPGPLGELPQLAPSFRDYLYNRLVLLLDASPPEEVSPNLADKYRDEALNVLKKHVETYQATFGYDHSSGGKLPRNHDWRPYRFCIQDVLFGSTVVKHHREANCLQVDVFLTANIPEYDSLAGAHALVSFLLSEAYKCGGTMEIRFSKKVEGGQVPQELQALAGRYGLSLGQGGRDRISPAEAKALYAALTDFSPELQTRINQLEQAGQIKMARACYVVHHGVWSKEQVEMIVLGSQRPDSILAGQAQPHQRHLYLHDLYHARAAVLGGLLDRRLAKQERFTDEGTPFDLEDDIRPLTITFEGNTYAKRYQSDEALPLPWLHGENRAIQIPANTPFRVLVRARDAADMLMHLSTDIMTAQHLQQQTGQLTTILVPYDFTDLPDEINQTLTAQLQEARVGLIVCPETVLNLDTEAAEKLARSRILRQ